MIIITAMILVIADVSKITVIITTSTFFMAFNSKYFALHYLPPASYLLLHPWTLDQDWSVPGCWLVQLDSYQWIGGTSRTSHCMLLLLLNLGNLALPYTPKYWILTCGREGIIQTPITDGIHFAKTDKLSCCQWEDCHSLRIINFLCVRSPYYGPQTCLLWHSVLILGGAVQF